MLTIRKLENFPRPALEQAVDEIGAGLGALYGLKAQSAYRQCAPATLSAALLSPEVAAWGACDGERLAGFLIALVRGGVAELSLLHLLREYTGKGIEDILLRRAVEELRAQGAGHIIYDTVPYFTGELHILETLGFSAIARQLMRAPLPAPAPSPGLPGGAIPGADLISRAAPYALFPEMAACLADVYEAHPRAALHPETRDCAAALNYILRIAEGGFGRAAPEHLRAIVIDGCCAGIILGCEIVPDWGFVLQVAVRTEFRGRGLGAALVRELENIFYAEGLTGISLGVTSDSPARRLYQHLGFTLHRPTTAYVWKQSLSCSPG